MIPLLPDTSLLSGTPEPATGRAGVLPSGRGAGAGTGTGTGTGSEAGAFPALLEALEMPELSQPPEAGMITLATGPLPQTLRPAPGKMAPAGGHCLPCDLPPHGDPKPQFSVGPSVVPSVMPGAPERPQPLLPRALAAPLEWLAGNREDVPANFARAGTGEAVQGAAALAVAQPGTHATSRTPAPTALHDAEIPVRQPGLPVQPVAPQAATKSGGLDADPEPCTLDTSAGKPPPVLADPAIALALAGVVALSASSTAPSTAAATAAPTPPVGSPAAPAGLPAGVRGPAGPSDPMAELAQATARARALLSRDGIVSVSQQEAPVAPRGPEDQSADAAPLQEMPPQIVTTPSLGAQALGAQALVGSRGPTAVGRPTVLPAQDRAPVRGAGLPVELAEVGDIPLAERPVTPAPRQTTPQEPQNVAAFVPLPTPPGEPGEGDSAAAQAPAAAQASGQQAAPAPALTAPQTASQTPPAIGPAPPPAIGTVPEPRADRGAPVELHNVIEQLADARQAGRSARPELSVRHNDFGAVTMRLELAGADLRATVSARDPGFVPAIQAALAERAVFAATESGSTSSQQQNGGASERGQHSGHPSEQRYGSSPGSGQGSQQPYRDHKGGDTEEAAARGRSGRSDARGDDRRDGGLFA